MGVYFLVIITALLDSLFFRYLPILGVYLPVGIFLLVMLFPRFGLIKMIQLSLIYALTLDVLSTNINLEIYLLYFLVTLISYLIYGITAKYNENSSNNEFFIPTTIVLISGATMFSIFNTYSISDNLGLAIIISYTIITAVICILLAVIYWISKSLFRQG